MIWQAKLALCAVIGAAIGYLLWREHHLTRTLNARTAELATANATIETERANVRKANEATLRESKRQDQLAAERRANPIPPVIVYRKAPRVSATCPTSTVPGEAAQTNDAGTDAGDSGRDIGPALDDFATDAEANLIQCEELIRWAQER